MNYAGIVAEYNPFHSGHQYQIQETRKQLGEDCGILVVMSGHWTQQGHCAILDKWTRAKLALEGGADLVIELPTLWATASAQSFARGAIYLLNATGMVTHLSFGSEGGDLSQLQALNQGLSHPDFSTHLQTALKTGISFPSARSKALQNVLPPHTASSLLQCPNNILGVEYLSALDYYKSTITPLTICREGAGFHQELQAEEPRPTHTSATDLRAKLHQKQWDYLPTYLSPNATTFLQERELPSLQHCETIFLSKLYTMTIDDWRKLPDSGSEEGLPQRLTTLGKQVTSTEEFLTKAKTKRYTHARLRRLLLSSFLSIEAQHIPTHPCYLRVLGLNPRGRDILQQMKHTASLPILTKTAHVHHLTPQCRNLFTQEASFTDLYHLCFAQRKAPGIEWKHPPIVEKN